MIAPLTCLDCGRKLRGNLYVRCEACRQKRIDMAHAEAQEVVAGGKCPRCGAALHRNLALAGWYLCDRSGAKGFRKDLTGVSCTFQCFTE